MYLSDRDLRWALKHGQLVVIPQPNEVGPTSIDLTLDKVEEAKVWDIPKFKATNRTAGLTDLPLLHIGKFEYKKFAEEYLTAPPWKKESKDDDLVYRDGDKIVVKPRGFVLWQTKEQVGTPEQGSQLICFVDGKSTRARTGIVVHMTAPTIHAAWGAWNVTLEIANLGPFYLVLEEGDSIAQVIVAQISSIPEKNMQETGSVTRGQAHVETSGG